MACLEWTTQMSLFFFESEKTPMQIPWAIPAFTARSVGLGPKIYFVWLPWFASVSYLSHGILEWQ